LAAKRIGMVVNCTGCGLGLMTGVVVQKRLQDTSHCIPVTTTTTPQLLYFLQPDMGNIYTLCFCIAVLFGPLDPEDECTFCVKSVGNSHLTTQHHIPDNLSLQKCCLNPKSHMSVPQVEEVTHVVHVPKPRS